MAISDSRDGSDGSRTYLPALTRPSTRFDTRALRYRPHPDGAARDGIPKSASSRLYLRKNLPAIYQEGDFGLRFLAALETLLDPIVAYLDSLPSHITAELAPKDWLIMLCAWLGIEIDEGWAEERLRDLVKHAADLSRMRGTKTGLELGLQIAFPHLPLRVEESGGVVTATDPAELPPQKEAAGFVVFCDQPLDEHEQASLARMIEHIKPVHVSYRLKVRAKKATEAKSP